MCYSFYIFILAQFVTKRLTSFIDRKLSLSIYPNYANISLFVLNVLRALLCQSLTFLIQDLLLDILNGNTCHDDYRQLSGSLCSYCVIHWIMIKYQQYS